MGRRKGFYSVSDVEALKFDPIPFGEKFANLLGAREPGGFWIVYGKSGHGKTRFALELANEFDRLGKRVLFVSLEMGMTNILQQEMEAAGLRGGINRLMINGGMGIAELDALMKRQRGPSVVIVDSLQYWQDAYNVNFEELFALKNKYRRRTFIMLSHVEGREVEGRIAYQVKRDSMVRILVEGFKAILKGRGKGGCTGEYVIWDEGAARYWLKDNAKE